MSIDRIKDIKLSISYTFLKTLEKYPDSHICRKYDDKFAKKTSNEASDLIKILDGDALLESWGKKLCLLIIITKWLELIRGQQQIYWLFQ